MRTRRYSDNLTDELYTTNNFDRIRKGIRKAVLATFLTASILFNNLGCTRSNSGAKHSYRSKIAFISERDGNTEIYTMNPDGTDQRRLTYSPALDLLPSWSPDGRKIAFPSLSQREGNEIYVMNADGTNQRNLTNNPAEDTNAFWSPFLRIKK